LRCINAELAGAVWVVPEPGTTMTDRQRAPSHPDLSPDGWTSLLDALREFRTVHGELFERFRHEAPATLGPEDAAKVRSLQRMLALLGLDADAVRGERPGTMRTLEAACLGCANRSRCDQELATGDAATSYPEFCANTGRLDALLRLQTQGAQP